MKEHYKVKYGNLFARDAILAIVVDILVCLSVAMVVFSPIYHNSLLNINYSMWLNIRLFLELISFFSFEDLNIVCAIEIISILLLLGAAIAALINIILNIVFLANKDVYIESKYKKMNLGAACKSTVSAALFATSLFFHFISYNVIKVFYNGIAESEIPEGLFYGNTYNITAINVLLVILAILILVVLIKKILGKRTEMHYLIDPSDEVNDVQESSKDENKPISDTSESINQQ